MEQLGEKIARPIVAIQIVHFTRNVGTKGLSWKVEIGRKKDRKNFGRREEMERFGEKIFFFFFN